MKIVNIVATVKLSDKFDLNILSDIFKGSKFPTNGIWLMWRTKPGNHYVAFYKSGKILITGKTEDQIHNTTQIILKLLKESGIKANIEKTEIHNIVLIDSIDLKKNLDDLFLQMGPKIVSFEPEQFPGLFYKNDEGVNITLFSSGKLIITGAKDVKTAKKSLKKFKKILSS